MKQLIDTEYWEPESLLAKLVVGARVRVRGFAECPWRNRSNAFHGQPGGNSCHEDKVVGSLGLVEATNNLEGEGHRFLVRFPDSKDGRVTTIFHGHYAAIELEPIEEVKNDT